jgi:2-polyprenyl-6-methoxyphenol hydroxylase-like FAD-dependent oxidoreductase
MLSEKGHKVVVYESRVEKTLFADSGRSFNITLTERGMRGLRLLKRTNLDKRIIASGIKCYGRRVHKHPSNQACRAERGAPHAGRSEAGSERERRAWMG